MVSEQLTRKMVQLFRSAGWTVTRSDGRHTVYACPCGKHTFALPDSHRTISPGVVRKALKAIEEG